MITDSCDFTAKKDLVKHSDAPADKNGCFFLIPEELQKETAHSEV